MPPPKRSPFLPTRLESIFFAVYPATLLLGSLFSLLDPAARSAPYNALTQSHPPEAAPSYFARKRNLFNIFFVKLGWFWTTLAFVVFLFSYGGPVSVLTPRRVQGLLRYALVTLWWVAVTRWFFGPPLIDRTFTLTGGTCQDNETIATGAACKAVGGRWSGGHDLSGHVFMLVLSSAFLWMEVIWVALQAAGAPEERVVASATEGSEIKNARSETQSVDLRQQGQGDLQPGFSIAAVIFGLSWWMLLMTAAYFHTWFEKVLFQHLKLVVHLFSFLLC